MIKKIDFDSRGFLCLNALNFILLLLVQASAIANTDSNLRQFASEVSQFASKQVLQPKTINYADEENGAALKKLLDPARIDVVMTEYFQATIEQKDVPQIHKLLEPVHKRIERSFESNPKEYELEHLDSLAWVVEFILRSRAVSKKAFQGASATSNSTANKGTGTATLSPLSTKQTDELLSSMSSLMDSISNIVALSIRDKALNGKFTGDRVARALQLADSLSIPTQVTNVRTRPLADGQISYKDMNLAQRLRYGERMYNAHCIACHGFQGKELGEIKAIVGSSALKTPSTLLNILLNGQNRGQMPSYKQLQDDEIASIANFIRSNFGKLESNIEPVDVLRLRK